MNAEARPPWRPFAADEPWSVWNLMLLVAFWMALRPFQGIYHDAVLYTGQAILHFDPVPLRNDLAFAHGSQDGFSLFSLFYAPVLEALGIGTGHMVTAIAGQVFWFVALVVLTRSLFGPTRLAFLAATAAVLLLPHYGADRLFTYGEPFATARPWAEALVLLAIAAGAGSGAPGALRWLGVPLAAACLLLALLLHPLMALPGIGVVGLIWCRRWPWLWVFAAVGVLALAALAFGGIEPFARAWRTFDPEWLGIVRERTGYLFMEQWTVRDWAQIASQVSLLLLARQQATPAFRAIIDATLLTATACLVVSAGGGDLAANLLVINLQVWRALWLVAVFANIGAGLLAWVLPPGSPVRLLVLGAVACQVIERLVNAPYVVSPLLAVAALAVDLAVRHGGEARRRMLRVLAVLLVVAGIALAVAMLLFAAVALRDQRGYGPWLAAALVVMPAAVLLLRRDWRLPRGGLSGAVALTLLAASVLLFDRRDSWARFSEGDTRREEVASFIGSDGLVYWEAGLKLLWFQQRRPAGFDCVQGAGLSFFRGMAIHYRDRAATMAPLNTSDLLPTTGRVCPPRQDLSRDGPADAAAVVEVCRAIPELDVIILGEGVPGLEGRIWRPPAPVHVVGADGKPQRRLETFHRYECRALR